MRGGLDSKREDARDRDRTGASEEGVGEVEQSKRRLRGSDFFLVFVLLALEPVRASSAHALVNKKIFNLEWMCGTMCLLSTGEQAGQSWTHAKPQGEARR